MAKDKIGIDQIEARLGRLDAPRQSYASNYDELPDAPRRERASEEEDDDGASVIFYSTLAAAFFAVMMGTMWLGGFKFNNPFGRGGNNGYVSSIAASCDKGWQDGRDNRDQLDCWFKRSISRLCSADERAALVQHISDYTTQAELAHAKELGSVMAMAGNIGGAMRIGIEDAMSRHSKNEAESQAHTEAAMQAAQDYMAPANAAIEVNRNSVSESALQKDFRALIKQGYITKSEFGWSSPAWVQDIFALEPGQDKPRCDS